MSFRGSIQSQAERFELLPTHHIEEQKRRSLAETQPLDITPQSNCDNLVQKDWAVTLDDDFQTIDGQASTQRRSYPKNKRKRRLIIQEETKVNEILQTQLVTIQDQKKFIGRSRIHEQMMRPLEDETKLSKKLPSINLQSVTQNSSKLDYQATLQPGYRIISEIRNNQQNAENQAIKYRRKKGALREISALSQTIGQGGSSLESYDMGLLQKRTPELFQNFNEGETRHQLDSSLEIYRDNQSLDSDIHIPVNQISVVQHQRGKTLKKKLSQALKDNNQTCSQIELFINQIQDEQFIQQLPGYKVYLKPINIFKNQSVPPLQKSGGAHTVTNVTANHSPSPAMIIKAKHKPSKSQALQNIAIASIKHTYSAQNNSTIQVKSKKVKTHQKMILSSLYDSYKDNIEEPYKDEFQKSTGINPTQKPQSTFGIVTSEGYQMMKIGVGSTTIRSSTSKLRKLSKRDESISDRESTSSEKVSSIHQQIFKRRRGGAGHKKAGKADTCFVLDNQNTIRIEGKRKTRLLSNPIHIEMQGDNLMMIGGADTLDHLNNDQKSSSNYDYFVPITSDRIDQINNRSITSSDLDSKINSSTIVIASETQKVGKIQLKKVFGKKNPVESPKKKLDQSTKLKLPKTSTNDEGIMSLQVKQAKSFNKQNSLQKQQQQSPNKSNKNEEIKPLVNLKPQQQQLYSPLINIIMPKPSNNKIQPTLQTAQLEKKHDTSSTRLLQKNDLEEDTLLKRELQTTRFVKLMNTDINQKLDLINQRFEERMRLRRELAMAREEQRRGGGSQMEESAGGVQGGVLVKSGTMVKRKTLAQLEGELGSTSTANNGEMRRKVMFQIEGEDQ